jgi:hypothetical protein
LVEQLLQLLVGLLNQALVEARDLGQDGLVVLLFPRQHVEVGRLVERPAVEPVFFGQDPQGHAVLEVEEVLEVVVVFRRLDLRVKDLAEPLEVRPFVDVVAVVLGVGQVLEDEQLPFLRFHLLYGLDVDRRVTPELGRVLADRARLVEALAQAAVGVLFRSDRLVDPERPFVVCDAGVGERVPLADDERHHVDPVLAGLLELEGPAALRHLEGRRCEPGVVVLGPLLGRCVHGLVGLLTLAFRLHLSDSSLSW